MTDWKHSNLTALLRPVHDLQASWTRWGVSGAREIGTYRKLGKAGFLDRAQRLYSGGRIACARTFMPIKYRPDIDGLRAISVLPVLFFRFGIDAISGGFTGVDVFFVISGYVITSTLYRQMLDGTFSILGFYERRIRRIFPAMLLVVAVTLAAGFFLLWPPEYVKLAQSAAASIAGGANIFFFLNIGYFDQSSDMLPLLHMWSLAVEEQFYLLWPYLLLVALYVGRRSLTSELGNWPWARSWSSCPHLQRAAAPLSLPQPPASG
jgi:peptidoglycan/LPS O-acetylase OafA/YrhL